jgi:hypothetical protein
MSRKRAWPRVYRPCYAEAMRAFLWRWRRLVLAAAFGICAAATMLLAVEREAYEDTLGAFNRVQVGMGFQEAQMLLAEQTALNSYKHPERVLRNWRWEHIGAFPVEVCQVGEYHLEIVFTPDSFVVLEKRRNPEPWLNLVVARRHCRWSNQRVQSYLNRYVCVTIINASYCWDVLRKMAN